MQATAMQLSSQPNEKAGSVMQRLTEKILAHSDGLPEGTPLAAKCLLHLGNRSAVDKALSRLAERGQLMRACRGVYIRPVTCEYGTYAPSVGLVINALSKQRGEVMVPIPAAAANYLGLSDHVPMRYAYLTSGRSRMIKVGNHDVKLRHAPRWQLVLAYKRAGDIVRALAWLGPNHVEDALKKLMRKIPATEINELAAVAPQLPNWLARSVGKAVHG